MSRHIRIFSGSTGLETKADPVRIKFDPKTGVGALAAAVNVEITDDKRIVRRSGFTATDRTESWHSLFSCGAYALGVMSDALCVIEPNMAYTALRNVQVGARMSWVRDTDGEKDVIYYANGYQTGRVIEKASHSWPLISPIGPAATIKEFYAPPLGHLLSTRNGRMFIAVDNFLYYSEPNTYHAYRLGANFFAFQSRIKMVEAVDNGLWISDSESLYFLGGNIAPTLQEMPVQRKMAVYPAIEGTAIKVPASRIGIEGLNGIVIVFTTPEGICVGSVDGNLINITEKKIDLPSALSGSGYYKDGHYITCID